MSESRKSIDARGLACPRPVVLTKKAVEEGGFDFLEVLVDNEAARENVVRFAEYSGFALVSVSGEPPSIAILIDARASEARSESGADVHVAAPGSVDAAAVAGATVFISCDRIGRGDDALGALLMRGFIYALAENDLPPARIILMNHGVRLAVEGSESLGNLTRLEEAGVEILVCGTCLELLSLKDALAAGRVSNMYEITGHLLSERILSL